MLEIFSSVTMGGVLLFVSLQKGNSIVSNDHKKIKQICSNSGLFKKEDGKKEEIVLKRKKQHKDYTEYIYKIPLGLSFKDFEDKSHIIQDGLNNKKNAVDISFDDIKKLKLNKDIITQIKKLLQKKPIHKEIAMSYDGMLRIKVYNQTLADSFDFYPALFDHSSGWKVYVGEGRDGVILHDTEDGHIVIAGATTFGKSNFLKMFIANLIHNQPDHTKLTLIDLKGGLSFARFHSLKQCSTLATDTPTALEALEAITSEMKAKQERYLAEGFENVREARDNERHFIIVDEAAQLSPSMASEKDEKKMKEKCESFMSEIARIGSSLGYRLIFCTQYPTADIMPRQIKANSTTKISFRLETATQSGVVLDETGAENIHLKGRCIYKTPSGIKFVQTPKVDNSDIEKVIEPYKIEKEGLTNAKPVNEDEERRENRKYTVEFEETGLS